MPYQRIRRGPSATPEYGIWSKARSRCTNPNDVSYRHYGARGITMCDRWLHSFDNFYADMGDRPGPKRGGGAPACSIERIDNDGPYSPENCRWATKSDQIRNSRHARILTVYGCSMPVVAWSEQLGTLSRFQITDRLYKGWDAERALFQPLRRVSQEWRPE